MPKTDEAAVLKRAKELCDQAGAVWDPSEYVSGKINSVMNVVL
jgi:hypothetical protein